MSVRILLRVESCGDMAVMCCVSLFLYSVLPKADSNSSSPVGTCRFIVRSCLAEIYQFILPVPMD